MSAPSCTTIFKNGEIVGQAYCNFGLISPNDYDVGIYLIKLVSGRYAESFSTSIIIPFEKEWDLLQNIHFGVITKERFYDLHEAVREIYQGVRSKRDFNISEYFNEVKK